MALIQTKGGFFFTLLVIVIISLFLLTYGIYNQFQKRTSEQRRIEALDTFLHTLEEDLQRQAYIAGFRALFIIENKISETGTYNSHVEQSIREIIFNGTLNNEPQPLMIGATFGEIQTTINERAAKLNAEVTLIQPTIEVYQKDPWKVTVQLNTTIDLQDKNDRARWVVNRSLSATIDVDNFEDPLYVIATNGLVTNKIVQTPYTLFVQGTNVANLSAHVANSHYAATPLAPNFMQRLEGDFTPHPQGIESFVNLPRLSAAGIPVLDKSTIDYIYFSSQNPETYSVQGMPGWFKIDEAHVGVYGVGNLTL